MLSIFLAATVTDACGENPGFLCEAVFDATGNETLADLVDFLVPLINAALILAVAWIVNRIVRRNHQPDHRWHHRVEVEAAGRGRTGAGEGRQAEALRGSAGTGAAP